MTGWPSGVLCPLQDEGLEDGGCPTQGDTSASLAFSMRRRRRRSLPPSPCLAWMWLVLVAAARQTPRACSRRGQLRDPGTLLPPSSVPWPVLGRREGAGSCSRARGAHSHPGSRGKQELGMSSKPPSTPEEQRGCLSSSPRTCQMGTEQQDMSPGGSQVPATPMTPPTSS